MVRLTSSALGRFVWLVAGALALPGRAQGGDLVFGPKDVSSVFCISKSQNKNQVHYAVRVDANCAPLGAAPVWAYWRMLEEGPSVLEPMLPREQPGYGIASQQVIAQTSDGGALRMTLRALPARGIMIETHKDGLGCAATATTLIGGTPAHLYNVHVKLKWPFGISYLLMAGRAVADARIVREKIDD